MATWTSITYSFGSLLTSAKMGLNQDNFLALAEGASGAPKILTAALNQVAGAQAVTVATIRPGTNNYLLRTNGSGAVEWSQLSASEIGAGAITQSKLSGANSDASLTSDTSGTGWNPPSKIVPAGGAYGFMPGVYTGYYAALPQAHRGAVSLFTDYYETYAGSTIFVNAQDILYENGSGGTYVYYYGLWVYEIHGGGTNTAFSRQRYVQASPPYDLGDGEVPLFVFANMRQDGSIKNVWVAPDPPWANNGPTITRPHFYRNGKGYRRVPKALRDLSALKSKSAVRTHSHDLPEINAERNDILRRIATAVDADYEDIEITQAIKQADMSIVPHPFLSLDAAAGESVVILDPVSKVVQQMVSLHSAPDQEDTVIALINDGYFKINNIALPRSGPPGVMAVDVKWKLTR